MLDEFDISAIQNRIKDRLSKRRYEHSLGVAKAAQRLAPNEGVSPQKAYLTGLLHDYAKPLKKSELIELVEDSEWEIDKTELRIPNILHAPAGAILVKRDFMIEDKDILEAIRFHTIGSPNMGLLARLIFAADFIDPNRNFPGAKRLRNLVTNDLDSSIYALCDSSIRYNIDHNRIIHPNTLLLRNAYLGGNMKNEKQIKK